jgi:hypothetical protein
MSSRLGQAVGALALLLLGPAHAEPTVTVLPLAFEVEELRGPNSYFAKTLPTTQLLSEKVAADRPLIAAWGKAGVAFVLEKGQLRTLPWTDGALVGAPLPEAPRTAIPGARMQTAGALTVYLSEPRSDYRHNVLGDAVEAGELTIAERQPLGGVSAQPRAVPTETTRIAAGPDAVFEDLEPRLADLDSDGTPEIVVVKSYRDKGSALAVIGRRDGVWRMLAETPPIGQSHRWLNPAGIADFDGDGKPEIALVKTPHLDGLLQIWSFDGTKLSLKHEAAGYANHALGSTALDNAVAVDVDGDGRPELVLPTLDRKSVAVLSLKGGVREMRRVALPAPVHRGVAALGSGKDTHVLAALEDGRIVLVRP